MSTILKALRRVEEEHGTDEPKPALEGDWLGDAPPEPPSKPGAGAAPRSLLGHWPWALAVVAGFGLIGTGGWLWTQRAVEAPAAASAQGKPAATRQVAEAPAEAVVPAVEPPSSEATAAAARYAQQRMREAAEAMQARRESPAPSGPDPSSSPPVARVASAPPTPVVSKGVPDPAPAATTTGAPLPVEERGEPVRVAATTALEPPPTPQPEPRRAPEPQASPQPEVPVVELLPAPPEIRVERTRWHPTPEKRTARVRIAGIEHDVREGETFDGLEVAEIRPSGIVFVHAGVRTERKILDR